MSIMVGTGRGATSGVLVKNAEALELMEKIDTLVVDKTGTLTLGRPKLVAVESVAGFKKVELLRLSAALERGSEHPLATAIVQGAEERGVDIPATANFASLTGKGVSGEVDGRKVALGNAALVADVGADAAPLQGRADEYRSEGQGVMFVAIDGALAG
jgi:Cu+-exporting ATPase